MTTIVAFLCHLGYIPQSGVLGISNGFLEFEVNHVHLKLLGALCLSTSLDSKNVQQISHISYNLLFNAQQGDKLFIQKYATTWTLSPLNLYLTDLLFLALIKG